MMSCKRLSGASCQLHDIQKEVRAAKKAAREKSSKAETACVWQFPENSSGSTTESLWQQQLAAPSPLSAEGSQQPLSHNQRYNPHQSGAAGVDTGLLPKSSKPPPSQHPQAADSSTVSSGDRCPTLGDSATSFDFRARPHSQQASPYSTSLPPPPSTHVEAAPHIGQRAPLSHQPANALGSALSTIALDAQGSGGLSHCRVCPEGESREARPANPLWSNLQLNLGRPRPLGRGSRRSHELAMGLGPEDIPLLSAARSPSPVGGPGRHAKNAPQHSQVSAETASAGKGSPHTSLCGVQTQAVRSGGTHVVHVSGPGRTPERCPVPASSPPENAFGAGTANLRNPCSGGEACSTTRAPDARLAQPLADPCDMAADCHSGVSCGDGGVGQAERSRGEPGNVDGLPGVTSSVACRVSQDCVGDGMAMRMTRSLTRASSASPMQDLLHKLRRLSDMRAALRAQVADVQEVLTKHPRPEDILTQHRKEDATKTHLPQLQSHSAQPNSQQAAQSEPDTCPPILRNCTPGLDSSPGSTALPSSQHGPWMQPPVTSSFAAQAGGPHNGIQGRSRDSNNMQRPRNNGAQLADITNSSQEAPSHTRIPQSSARAGQHGAMGIGAREMKCGPLGMCNAGNLLCSGEAEKVAEAMDQQCNALGSNTEPPPPSGVENHALQTIQTPGSDRVSTACDSMLGSRDSKQCGMIPVGLAGTLLLKEHHKTEGSGQFDIPSVPKTLDETQNGQHRRMFEQLGSNIYPRTGTGSHEQHRSPCISGAVSAEPHRPCRALAGNRKQPGGGSTAPGDGSSSKGWPLQVPGEGQAMENSKELGADHGSSSKGSPLQSKAHAWGHKDRGDSAGNESGLQGTQRDQNWAFSDGDSRKSLSRTGSCRTPYDGPVLTWNIRGGRGPTHCPLPPVVAEGWPLPGVRSWGMHSDGTPVAAEATGHGGAGMDSWGAPLEGTHVAAPARVEGGAGAPSWGTPSEGAGLNVIPQLRGQGGAGVDSRGSPARGVHIAAQARGHDGAGVDSWGTPSGGTPIAVQPRGQGGAGLDLWVNPLETAQDATQASGQCLQQSERETVEPFHFNGHEPEEQLGFIDGERAEWVGRQSRHAMWIPAHAASWKRPAASNVKVEPQSEAPLDCQGSYAEAARLARQRDEQERQRQRQISREKLVIRRAASRCIVAQPQQVLVQKENAKTVVPKPLTRYAHLLSKRPTHSQQGTPAQAEQDGHGAMQADSVTKTSEADAVLQPLSLSAEEAKLVASLQRLDGAINSSRRLFATAGPPSPSLPTPTRPSSQPCDQAPATASLRGPDHNPHVDVPKGHVTETGAAQLPLHSRPASRGHPLGGDTRGETREGEKVEDKQAASPKSGGSGGKRGALVQATAAQPPCVPQIPGKGKRFGVWSRPMSEPAAGRVASGQAAANPRVTSGQAAANPAAESMASRASRLQRLTQRKNSIKSSPLQHGPSLCCDTVPTSTQHQPKSNPQNLNPHAGHTPSEHATYPAGHNPMHPFGTMSTFRGPAANDGPQHMQTQGCWPDSTNDRQGPRPLHHGAPQARQKDYHAHTQSPEVRHLNYYAHSQPQADIYMPSAVNHRLQKRPSGLSDTPPTVVPQWGLQSTCGSGRQAARGATADWAEYSPSVALAPLHKCRTTCETDAPIRPSTAGMTSTVWRGPQPHSHGPYTPGHAPMQYLNGTPQGLPVDPYSRQTPADSSMRASSAHALHAERPPHGWGWPGPLGWGQPPQMCGPNATRPLAWEHPSACHSPPIYPPQASTAIPASTSAPPHTTVFRDTMGPLPWAHMPDGQGPIGRDACHEHSANSGNTLTFEGDGAGAHMGRQQDAALPHCRHQNPGEAHGQQVKDPLTQSPAVKASGWDCLFWPEEAPDISPSGDNSICRDQVRMLAGRVGDAAFRASMCASPMSNRKSRVGPLGAQSSMTRRFSPASVGRSPSEKSGRGGNAANSPPQKQRHVPVKRPTGGTITSFNWKAWQGC